MVVNLTDGKALDLCCLAIDCNYKFTENTLEQFLTEKQFNRYQQFLLAAAIRADPNKKCCPSPDCLGILVKNVQKPNLENGNGSESHGEKQPRSDWIPDEKYTRCDSCLVEYCFDCMRKFHPGFTCKEYEKQLRLQQMLTDEEDMKRWQEANNAKPCPRCKVFLSLPPFYLPFLFSFLDSSLSSLSVFALSSLFLISLLPSLFLSLVCNLAHLHPPFLFLPAPFYPSSLYLPPLSIIVSPLFLPISQICIFLFFTGKLSH